MAQPTRRATRGGFGLLLLASQIMSIGIEHIPPVTLVTVIAQVLIYMRLIPNIPNLHKACTSNHHVWNRKQWSRLCLSSFYHLDDMHLYYNMVSFIWKGMKLERRMGSKKFLIVLTLFSVLTQVVMLMLNKLFAEALSSDHFLKTCAAGFSAVIFSLKVLTTADSDENVNVMGLPINVPSKYACWAELILIHILVPNSSFTGHLAGILVGLLYTKGPLKPLVKAFNHLTSGDIFIHRHANSSYTPRAAATGYRQQTDEDEAIQRAIQESLRHSSFQERSTTSHGYNNRPPSYGWNIDNDPPPPPQGVRNRMYPDLSSSNPSPSAPPYSASEGAPYPPSNDPPYPTGDNLPFTSPSFSSQYPTADSGLPYPTVERTDDSSEALRQARLRRFDHR